MRFVLRVILFAAFLAPGLRADIPGVMGRVPPDAMGALVIPDLRTFNDHTTQLIGAMELTSSNLEQVLGVLGIRGALDLDAPAIAILHPFDPEDGDAYHQWVALLPTTSAEALPAALRAVPDEPLQRFEFNRSTLWIRALSPRLAAISPSRDRLQALTDAAPHLAHHRDLLAGAAPALADADAFLYVNVAHADQLIALLRAGVRGDLAALPVPADTVLAREIGRFVEHNADLLERDGQAALIAFSCSALGARVDLAASFRPDSDFGRQLTLETVNARPLDGIPDAPLIAALWLRMDQDILGTMSPDRAEDPAEVIDYAGMLRGTRHAEVGVLAPAALAQGLLSRTVIHFEGADPGVVRERFRAHLGEVEATWKPGSVAPMEADAWTMTLPGASRAGAALYFGPGAALRGPSGLFHLRAEDGFVTLAQHPGLLIDAIEATDGHGPRLSENVIVGQLLSLLPEQFDALALVSVEAILPQIAPLIEGFVGGKVTAPPQLPPVGATLRARDHATHASVYIPTPDLRFMLDLYRTWDAARGAGPASTPQP